MEGIIYRAFHLESERSYVGQTSATLKQRLYTHRYHMKTGTDTHFYNALRKYGWDAFRWEVLEEVEDVSKLDSREIWWISRYDSCRKGFNITQGGGGHRGFSPSAATVEKTRKRMFGNKFRLGIPHTEEACLKMSKSRRGRKLTEAAKKAISESRIGVKNCMAKLDEDKVLWIRRVVGHGYLNYTQVMKALDISRSRVSVVVLKQEWKHVND